MDGLPAAVVGIICRCCASFERSDNERHRVLRAVNLTCRGLHDVLPSAFASLTLDDADADADMAHDDQQCQDSHTPFSAEVNFHRHKRDAVANGPLPLVVDLDAMGAAAFRQAVGRSDVVNGLRRLATRFARAPCVRLVLKTPLGTVGMALFVEHAAPLLLGVRRLLVDGPHEFALPPLWWRAYPQPAQSLAAPMLSRLSELSLTSAHGGQDLQAMLFLLPDVCPRLRTLHLAVDTAAAVGLRAPLRQHVMLDDDPPTPQRCCALTVALPASLRLLLVNLEEYASGDAGDVGYAAMPFVLTLSGGGGDGGGSGSASRRGRRSPSRSPSRSTSRSPSPRDAANRVNTTGCLTTVKVHSWYLSDELDQLGDQDMTTDPRPVQLRCCVGHDGFPALAHLELTVAEAWGGHRTAWASVARMCPALETLTLFASGTSSLYGAAAVAAWPGFMEELQSPAASSLRRITMRYDGDGGMWTGEVQQLLSQLRRWTPMSVELRSESDAGFSGRHSSVVDDGR